MSNDDRATKSAPVLDPVDRSSESIFGVLMALTFTGTVSVATAGRQEVHTMLLAALGSNLAWGLTDAVMYLVDTATQRSRVVSLVKRVRTSRDPAEADALIADEIPDRLATMVGPNVIEAVRGHILKLPELHAGLGRDDYAGAGAVALLVVAATLPVVIPFMLIDDVMVALRVSNGLALASLFVSGWILGRYAYGNPWRAGLTMAAIGAALVCAIVALGG